MRLRALSGVLNDYIQDARFPEEGKRRVRQDDFFDLQLDIKDSLEESLKAYVTPERMDGENQWCPEEGLEKVDALKGLSFKTVPQLLTLHLRRFLFDYNTMQRMKVSLQPLHLSFILINKLIRTPLTKVNEPMEMPERVSLSHAAS